MPDKTFLESQKVNLLHVQTPGRYVGGEFGIIRKDDTDLTMALAFPDLYEIGMSNLAIRKMYSDINQLKGVRCERVFCPAPDFEQVLKEKAISLYTLENYIPLSQVDILGFSVGYELSATNIITMLETGGIGIRAEDRTLHDPIVIAGGPAISNPKPLSMFLDAYYFGEAEAGFYGLLEEIAVAKRRGEGRRELLGLLFNSEYTWSANKLSGAKRAVWLGFGQEKRQSPECLPVPSIRTVQDHGVIEIMRGCPNGCRFCHAGYYYRPCREKSIDCIASEADQLVNNCGYREITLASLSTGDYSGLMPLIDRLVRKYSASNVSFALPSLRVDDFTLPVIELLGSVRKSGLTFAVETPAPEQQLGINKRVQIDEIIEILKTAEKNGWRSAKLYFMVGLPICDESESDKIIEFIQTLLRNTRMSLHVNVGTFIPKPHTPFERASQLTEDEALLRINRIRSGTKNRRVKFGYHAPFTSFLEGLITRGDERVGEIIYSAYRAGARLDAWEDYLDRDIWRKIIEEAPWDVESEICNEIPDSRDVPWNVIDPIISPSFLHEEKEKSLAVELTESCKEICTHNCGVCTKECKINRSSFLQEETVDSSVPREEYTHREQDLPDAETTHAYLISYEKLDEAIFWSHINIMTIFERTLQRANYPVAFTQGYNPKPRIDFAQPIPLGVGSREELVQVVLRGAYDVEEMKSNIDCCLPHGLHITRCASVRWDGSRKLRKLMSMYDSSIFKLSIPFSRTDHRQDNRQTAENVIRALKDRGPLVDARKSLPAIDTEFQVLNGYCATMDSKENQAVAGSRTMEYFFRCISVKKMLESFAEISSEISRPADVLGLLAIERVATLRRQDTVVDDYFSLCL